MHGKLSSDDIQKIINLYQTTNLDKVDIGKMYSINPSSVGYWLKLYNIPPKPRLTNKYHKYPFDGSFFLNENEQSAYFFGFVLGDGSIIVKPTRHQYLLSLQVHVKDKYILEMFCDWIKCSKQAIGQTKNKLCQLRLSSKQLFTQDFSKWGLVPNKTYNGVSPDIENAYLIRPFIIGLIDADGSISLKEPGTNRSNRLSLTSSKIVIDWYISALRSLGFDGKITHISPPNKSWARANITKKNDIIKIANLLNITRYKFKMKRKWNQLTNLVQT